MKLIKLSKKATTVISHLQTGKRIAISRYSSVRFITGTDIHVSDTLIDTLINKDIVTSDGSGDIHNFYALTDLGKSLKID